MKTNECDECHKEASEGTWFDLGEDGGNLFVCKGCLAVGPRCDVCQAKQEVKEHRHCKAYFLCLDCRKKKGLKEDDFCQRDETASSWAEENAPLPPFRFERLILPK